MKDKDKVKGRYFYLMLKENFYDNDDMVLLESMENGYKYSNILLKLYLKSLKDKGKLMYKDRIPYSVEMIAKLTRHDSDTVRRAIEIFQQMGIIEILDNGAIFMMDIENYIGKSSTEADRRRAYDRRIADEKRKILIENNDEKSCEKSHEHIDLELNTDLDSELNINSPDESEQNEPQQEIITDKINYKKIIDRLNELAGTSYRASSKATKDLIKARINEKFTEEDILLVVEKMCYLWNKEPKGNETDMRPYLRPSTLFRAGNFENYLNMQVQEKKLTTKDIQDKIDFSDF